MSVVVFEKRVQKINYDLLSCYNPVAQPTNLDGHFRLAQILMQSQMKADKGVFYSANNELWKPTPVFGKQSLYTFIVENLSGSEGKFALSSFPNVKGVICDLTEANDPKIMNLWTTITSNVFRLATQESFRTISKPSDTSEDGFALWLGQISLLKTLASFQSKNPKQS